MSRRKRDTHFGPDSLDLQFLWATRKASWDEFWIAGGDFERSRREAGLFEISQLVIGRQSRLLIAADGIDTGDLDEVFWVSVGEDKNFGVLAHERRFRPRRARITGFPNDLDLKPFANPGREYALVTIHRDATVDGAYDGVSVDAGLLVTARGGQRLLFYCDQDEPYVMIMTCDPLRIEQYVTEAAGLRRLRAREA